MKPYGWKPHFYRGEDGGPSTQFAPGLSSDKRTRDRRKLHKIGRKGARKAIVDSIVEHIFRPGRNRN